MSQPRTTTVSDPRTAAALADRAEADRDQRLADVRKVMATPEGRRYLLRRLVRDRVFSSLYHPTGSEVYRRIGRHDRALQQFAELAEAYEHESDPRALVEFILEGLRMGMELDNG